MEARKFNNGYMMVGLLLILLGVVFLIGSLGVAGLDWGTIWPLYIVAVGLVPIWSAFTGSRDNPSRRALPVMVGAFLLMLGIFFLATTLDYITWADQAKLWPVYIVLIGIAALAGYITSGLGRYGYLATGITLSLLGGGFLAATLSGILYDIRWTWFETFRGWFGFDWATAWWPIFPIVAGLLLLLVSALTANTGVRSALAFVGTIPLLVGIFFQATTLGVITWNDQGRLWPIYPIIVAAASLAAYFASNREAGAYLVPAAIFGAVGLLFLPATLINESLMGQAWPLLLILAGGLLLFVQRNRHITR